MNTATCPTCLGTGSTFYMDEFGPSGYLDCGRCNGSGEVPCCAADGCPEPAERGGTHCCWCAEDSIPAPPALPRECRVTDAPAKAS